MWQRIQTLYLLISAALCAVLLFGTAYKVADPAGMLEVSYFQLQKPFFAILLCILSFLVALAHPPDEAGSAFRHHSPGYADLAWLDVFQL